MAGRAKAARTEEGEASPPANATILDLMEQGLAGALTLLNGRQRAPLRRVSRQGRRVANSHLRSVQVCTEEQRTNSRCLC